MDLVLFGATGFTGKLVAEYLRGKPIEWALAGRDRVKLEGLKRELGVDVPILVGDVRDPASLEAIVRGARVVCNTVGPYAKYGSPVVAACAQHGVDYCDLTGETHWIRRMIDAHHEQAQKTGARIVHCCGFDSIPSDLGVWAMQDHAQRAHGRPCTSIVYALEKSRGGVSGGTIASMMNIFDESRKDRDILKVLFDPYALNPAGERGPDGPDQRGVAFDRALDAWTAPFVMAAINTRIVRRTNALGDYRYGRDFSYREVMSFPKGPRGLAMAASVTAGLGAFFAAAALPPMRKLLESTVLPKPGEGPSAHTRERGSFSVRLVGKGDGFTCEGRFAGRGDPGYGATSVMLAESALCLAVDGRSTGGGILTPAHAMGEKLAARLRTAGFTIEAR